VIWKAPSSLDLASWSALTRLPGAARVELPAEDAPACEERLEDLPGTKALRFSASSAEEARRLARCGFGVVLEVEPSVSTEQLLELFAAMPGLELQVHVGDDAARAWALRRLFDSLG
jgi:hypothetical protein